ncbi:uncharacterized protein CMC5_080850 [Chondromyces crocatus]|uniref:Uncharacterized protein n=1 Tax=Chondromyces crocatus TaxID=52 RepID=A0A0K1ET87_CHOCO|nr:uncharacterized protein CMC5_080850 [Chondromyces crocatus]
MLRVEVTLSRLAPDTDTPEHDIEVTIHDTPDVASWRYLDVATGRDAPHDPGGTTRTKGACG